MFRKLSLVLVFVLGTFSVGVSALGLGEIKLNSGLNQPLKAEIELFSPEGMSEFEVAASLASRAEFEKAGIDYLSFLRDIRFKTVKQGEKLFIEVTTRQPIKEPFLNILVELNWPKGRMLREYTMLLDPPVFSQSKSSTVNQATSQPSATQQPTTTRSVAQPRQSTAVERKAVFSGESYGPVGNAETLWGIATQVKPGNATIHQTLVALYRANPEAFLNGDINLLKQGAVLDIPSAEQIASTPQRAALQDMVARLRGGSRDSVLDTSGRQSSSQQATRSGDRLRLATPSSSSSGEQSGSSVNGEQVSNLRSELAQTKEAAATLEAENEELRRKLQDALSKLEQQDSSAVNLDSTTGAALANQDDVFANEEPDLSEDETATSEQSSMESAQDASQGSDDAMLPPTESDDSALDSSVQTDESMAARSDDEPKPDMENQTKSESKPASTKPSSSLSRPPKSTSWYDEPLYLYGSIALIVVLLGAFAVFWKMRQRMSEEEFQDDLVGSTKGSGFDTEESMDMPDVGDDLLGDLDSDDVFDEDSSSDADPLGEADIYIAYGKYDQAEKLLKEAIEQHPERTDLKLKLLECFGETKDKTSFEEFESIHNDVWAADSDAARQVSEIKSQAWPGETSVDDEFELPSTEEIFGDDEPSSDVELDDDFSLDDLDTESEVSLDETLEQSEIGGEEQDFDTDDLDFDINESASDTDTSADKDEFSLDDESFDLDTEGDDLNLDLDDDLGSDSDLADASADEISLDLDDDSLDTSLDIESEDSSATASLEDDLDADLDLSGDMDLDGDFDLDDDDSLDDDLMDGTDEASTKLDLARAYIDMGDTDGAKEILNEVVEEGSEAHKNEALGLLEKI